MKLFCQWNQFTFINTFWLWLVHQIDNDFLSNKSIFTVTLTARKPFRLFQVLHPSGSDAAPIIGQRHDTWHEHFLWHENPPVDEGAIVVQQDSCDWEPLELMVGWKTNPWNWTHGINESRPNLFLSSGCIHIDSLRWPASRPTTHHWSRSEAPGSKKNSFIALHFGHGIPLGRPETIAMAVKITIYFDISNRLVIALLLFNTFLQGTLRRVAMVFCSMPCWPTFPNGPQLYPYRMDVLLFFQLNCGFGGDTKWSNVFKNRKGALDQKLVLSTGNSVSCLFWCVESKVLIFAAYFNSFWGSEATSSSRGALSAFTPEIVAHSKTWDGPWCKTNLLRPRAAS